MSRQCVSDWNPNDDRNAPDWWLDMTKAEQDAYMVEAKSEHEIIVEAERREKEKYADLICEVCCAPLHAPVYERTDGSLVCSLCERGE